MEVCFKHPETGEKVCFHIPILVHRWPPIDPLRGREEFNHGPMPDPWITARGIKPELAHDLQVLASIDALSATLSTVGKGALQKVVRAEVANVKLPEGLEFGFKH